MPEVREYARAGLAQSDEQLAADCEVRLIAPSGGGRPGLYLRHRPTGIEVQVEARATDEQTRLIALLQLRNRFYDVLRTPVARR